MKKYLFVPFFSLFFLFLVSGLSFSQGLVWKNHRAPFDFTFGNHMDTHQQTQILPDGSLFGYLYIAYTGEETPEGVPVARHQDCNDEEVKCVVGWELRGLPGFANFFDHLMGDHPVWSVSRSQIPVPGSYTHFHWEGPPEHAHALTYQDMDVPGYFLQLRAKRTFLFEHGDDEVFVTHGVDNATHLNIISGSPGVGVFPDH